MVHPLINTVLHIIAIFNTLILYRCHYIRYYFSVITIFHHWSSVHVKLKTKEVTRSKQSISDNSTSFL